MSIALKTFREDESGAITVDWVVLTAAVCLLIGTSYWLLKDNSDSLAAWTGSYIADRNVGE